MKTNNKREYIAPAIEITSIELEEAIAAVSVRPGNSNDPFVIKEEWIVDEDVNRTFNW
jgi:hypothetical protein